MRAMAYNNAWANHRLHTACAALSQAEFEALRTGFFPSLKATLNHIVIIDWFYVDALGFENVNWGTDDFTSVSRDRAAIYLCRGDQGRGGAWVWIGVEDAEKLHAELKARCVTIRMPPTNYPWALEMQIEDPDGNVLRLGSEPR